MSEASLKTSGSSVVMKRVAGGHLYFENTLGSVEVRETGFDTNIMLSLTKKQSICLSLVK